MNPTTMRSFALGILTCTIVFSFYHYFQADRTNIPLGEEQITEQQIQEHIEQAGLKLLPEEEYQRLYDQDKKLSSIKEEQSKKTNEVRVYSLTIESGMTSRHIANLLEKQNIIKDADEFQDFLDAKDASRYIQIGTFDVSNEMSYEEIANLLTK